jgi:catechol-2,3-dioxygenase
MSVRMVDDVRSVAFGVPDPKATAKFFAEIWGLSKAGEADGVTYLRGTGPYHHIVSLQRRPKTEILELALTSPDRSSVDAAYMALRSQGIDASRPAAFSNAAGGGYGFLFTDPDGRRVRVVCEGARHTDTAEAIDCPIRIGHVVLTTPDFKRTGEFYCDVLGFQAQMRPIAAFMKCNDDHHNIAFFGGETSRLDHVAFLMPEVDSVVRGVTRMKGNGFHMGWGVGQHGDGADVYAYFCGPDGLCIEYTTKVAPSWAGAVGKTEYWDEAEKPTPQLNASRSHIPFVAA